MKTRQRVVYLGLCISPAMYCGEAPKVENGYTKASTGVVYQGTVTYECFTGFGITGNPQITCNSDGSWSTPPTCQSEFP